MARMSGRCYGSTRQATSSLFFIFCLFVKIVCFCIDLISIAETRVPISSSSICPCRESSGVLNTLSLFVFNSCVLKTMRNKIMCYEMTTTCFESVFFSIMIMLTGMYLFSDSNLPSCSLQNPRYKCPYRIDPDDTLARSNRTSHILSLKHARRW